MRLDFLLPVALGAMSMLSSAVLGDPNVSASRPPAQHAGTQMAPATAAAPGPSATNSRGSDADLTAATSAPIKRAVGNFALDVPFRTQKDGARFQGANCGPASLAMVLEAFGMGQTNSDLRWLAQLYHGNPGRGGGTALEDLAAVGRDFGLDPIGPYDGDDFAQWTIGDIEDQLRQEHPVIALVKYRLLPDHLDSPIGYDHYVVLFGVEGDQFLYHDPAYESAADGADHWISAAQLNVAMGVASIPHQAVAFAPGAFQALRAKGL